MGATGKTRRLYLLSVDRSATKVASRRPSRRTPSPEDSSARRSSVD